MFTWIFFIWFTRSFSHKFIIMYHGSYLRSHVYFITYLIMFTWSCSHGNSHCIRFTWSWSLGHVHMVMFTLLCLIGLDCFSIYLVQFTRSCLFGRIQYSLDHVHLVMFICLVHVVMFTWSCSHGLVPSVIFTWSFCFLSFHRSIFALIHDSKIGMDIGCSLALLS